MADAADMKRWLEKYGISPEKAEGMTSAQAQAYQEQHGFNELPTVEVSKWVIFISQFMGTMPYMLEISLIVCLVVQDWIDAIIISCMLICNGGLGFKEECECLEALEKLTQSMETKVTVQRDGMGQSLPTRELVPGDIVLLLGGLQVPADILWFKGDQLAIDTAAMTGEGIPRKYPSDNYGNKIECGTTVAAGEAYGIVHAIGMDTEIGATTAEIQQDKAKGHVPSVFEERVMLSVKIIIMVSLVICVCIFIQQGITNNELTSRLYKKDLLAVLSVIIAAIPIALPIVMNVTMSLGAAKMATDFAAVVTNIPALQDIASMSVLCSDKTGTLTTAKMTINHDMVWCNDKFTAKDVGFYAMLASSRDKKEDAVDRTVVKYFDKQFGPAGQAMCDEYTKTGGMGFNPIYKRVTVNLTHPKLGSLKIAKGLATKVVDTEDGGKDDAEEQWLVADIDTVRPNVRDMDKQLSSSGYKTLGVAIKINDQPWTFCGILPMMDPPREDSAKTVMDLAKAGIKTKMITGDHLNIAIETARQIGIGKAIYPGSEVRSGLETAKQNILAADGFAQVLPSDKREVVEVLKTTHGLVVGMTGDGVNDAPALSAAQVGVAVDDATDAAMNAAAILLRAPGLSAIYSGVVESRRIFRKLKSYVTYRFAASIQIVVCLSVLTVASNCAINPTFIIFLALFNDLTMLPIAYDYQKASTTPENPDVNKILFMSASLGLMESFATLLFSYGVGSSNLSKAFLTVQACPYPLPGESFKTPFDPDDAPPMSIAIQGAIWLQMFVASELLIFSVRAPGRMGTSLGPSPYLVASVLGGCFLATLVACVMPYFGKIPFVDAVLIWIYDIVILIFIDLIKIKLLSFLGENSETLPDEIYIPPKREDEDDEEIQAINLTVPDDQKMTTRESAAAYRMTKELPGGMERLSQVDGGRASAARGSVSGGRASVASRAASTGNHSSDLRNSYVTTGGSLRPHTPASRAAATKR